MLESLGEAAIRTLLLACVVQCALWLLRVRQARLLLAAWTVVLVASVAMPVLQRQTPFHLLTGPELSAPLIDGASEMMPSRLLPGLVDGANGNVGTAPSPASWVASAYLVVCACMLLRVTLGVGLCCRLVVRAVPVRSGWAQGARVRISRHVTGPVTIANVILLPTDVLDWPADVRQAVLAHERAHVARWDFATLIASQLNRCLFWFSPLSWWLHRRLVALTERASDDEAIAVSGDRLRYAEILLEMARQSGPVSQGLAMARPATLADRIDRILVGEVNPYPVDRAQLASFVIGAVSLSILAASMISRSGANPSMAPVSVGSEVNDLPATRSTDDGPAFGQGSVVQQGAALLPSATTLPPLRVGDATVETSSGARSVSPSSGADVAAKMPANKFSNRSSRQPPPTTQTISGSARLPHAAARPVQAIQDNELNDGVARIAAIEGTLLPTSGADGSGVRPRVSDRPQAPRSPNTVSPALPAEFQSLVGSTCTGAVTIGPNARNSPDRQPDVVAGQLIPARAHFHVKPDGAAWVRFDAFGQQSLDLPLRFNQYGMTWTGGHGIAYTVRLGADGRLTGLAGFFRNDSARLDLTCI